jgi:4-phospho-D-threonate 3-dehydrogenase / 4-phospho-D-erythronate 3-dehydrogenase
MDDFRPRVAITLGDPAGIGTEVVLKALADPDVRRLVRPLIVGEAGLVDRSLTACGLDLKVRPVSSGDWPDDAVALVEVDDVQTDAPLGEASPEGGEAAWRFLERGAALCLAGVADGLVTAPINKYALELAGRGHDGHTEILMHLTDSQWSQTLFLLGDLRSLFFSRHLSLRDAIAAVKADAICDQLVRFRSVAAVLGLEDPLIAVAGLNPHAGEHGLFGREEIDEVVPGIAAAKAQGVRVEGPIPADAVFHQARSGRYDVVLSLYHDQVSAVLKAIDFHRVVSVTLGLPFLRFSVDHGTGYDIAGRGIADPTNMAETLRCAASTISNDRQRSGDLTGGRR